MDQGHRPVHVGHFRTIFLGPLFSYIFRAMVKHGERKVIDDLREEIKIN